MSSKRPLVPGFLNRRNKYFLLNNPGGWLAKARPVVCYGIVIDLIMALLCLFVPDDPRKQTTVYMWMLIALIIAVIGLILWLIFPTRFNVFRGFGFAGKNSNLDMLLLYFITSAVILSVIFIPPIVQSVKANLAYGDKEMAKDVNDMNLAISLLNIDSIPPAWYPDTLRVRTQSEIAINGNPVLPGHTNHFRLLYANDVSNTKKFADSLVTINDSLFVVFKGPQYAFLNVFDYWDGVPVYRPGLGILGTSEIYSRIFNRPRTTDKKKLQEQLDWLLFKYGPHRQIKSNLYPYDGRDWEDYTPTNSYFFTIRGKYGLDDVQNSINNISGRKYLLQWHGSLPVLLRFFGYATLIITLILFYFRAIGKKDFFSLF